jgi:glycosyltransferase involved in cell wall biosynthesis
VRIIAFSERLAPPADEGIKALALGLADGLRALGHEVTTLTSGGVDWPERRVRNIHAGRLLQSRELAAEVAACWPDLVLYLPTASLTLASGLRSRVLRSYAGSPVAMVATQGRRHRGAVRLAARLAGPDRCFAQSAGTREQARALGWRVGALPAAVDAVRFTPVSSREKARLREKHGLPAGAPIVLHAGHLNRGRGVADLAVLGPGAWPLLLASTSTPQDPALLAELEAAGVHVIRRYIPEVHELYQAADAYLFPVPPDEEDPRSIDLPLSVLEAAACNLPLLARRYPSLASGWLDAPGVAFYDDPRELPGLLAALMDVAPATRSCVAGMSWEAAAAALLAGMVGEEVAA